MSRSRVSFGRNDVLIHSGSEGTPSPQMSDSTFESPELASPPTLPNLSLSCGSPLTSPTFKLDDILKVSSPSQLRLFNYDLSRNPDTDPFTPKGSMTAEMLNRRATTPAVPSILVLVNTGSFQWITEIMASQRDKGVTVKDVIWGLYQDFRKPFNPAKLSPEQLALANISLASRTKRLAEKEGLQGTPTLSRIDILGKGHKFAGLAFVPKRGHWELFFEEV
ncbi:hypothetical protein FA15DRAFT_445572 [Coprinopsis marcescibilis]|uniref:DUF6699 domain-containing protein n=1 Tax=Coprinopsis marcescibilis TaxID=230819 RepID=A0A5C3KV91_COPMA|nr:hypothetical protein FA15DRAFT_445572 [Coprinopsis marcescibilis]